MSTNNQFTTVTLSHRHNTDTILLASNVRIQPNNS